MRVDNVKGIIWDLDGTLIDSFAIFQDVLAEVVAESGHKMPTKEVFEKNYHGSLEETVQNLLGIKSAKELNEIVLSFLSKQEKYYAGDLNPHLFIDAVTLVQKAAKKGMYQLLVTNRQHQGRGNASPNVIVASTVLSDSIKEVRSGDDVELRKPSKASIGDWDVKHGLKPEEIVVIGDQFIDAKLAINLGSRAILVKRNDSIAHPDSDNLLNNNLVKIVDSLDDVELM